MWYTGFVDEGNPKIRKEVFDMARKTIDVEYMKKFVNDFLLNSADEQTVERQSYCTIIEELLYQTGNYKGFNYLTRIDMETSEHGTTVGIALHTDDDDPFISSVSDPTRIRYY